eukprot:366398-Chlamydomonas_euryale.AAC.4
MSALFRPSRLELGRALFWHAVCWRLQRYTVFRVARNAWRWRAGVRKVASCGPTCRPCRPPHTCLRVCVPCSDDDVRPSNGTGGTSDGERLAHACTGGLAYEGVARCLQPLATDGCAATHGHVAARHSQS